MTSIQNIEESVSSISLNEDKILENKLIDLVFNKKRNIYLAGAGGFGKCVSNDTKILLMNGNYKKAGDINFEDILVGDDGKPREIHNIEYGEDEMYELKFLNNQSLKVTRNHELTFCCLLPRLSEESNPNDECAVSYFNYETYEIKTKTFRNTETAIYFANTLPPFGTMVDIPLISIKDKLSDKLYSNNLVSITCKFIDYPENNLEIDPYEMGKNIGRRSIDNISYKYKLNSKRNRLNFLAGVIDYGGLVTGTGCNIFLRDNTIDDVEFICRSLGFIASKNKNILSIAGNLKTIPTVFTRLRSSVISYYDTITSINYIGRRSYTGLLLDGNHRFLLSNFMVTHNSHIIRHTIKPYANLREIEMGITSTTGVSALSLGGGTIHRWSGIKLGKESVYTICENIRTKNKDCYKRWRDTRILHIDEVSMLGLKTFELLDKVGRNICEINLPFGGKQIILSGDFLQLPPVNDEFPFKSDVWDELDLYIFRMTIPRRYPDINHCEMLMRIRMGHYTKEDVKKLNSRVESYIDYVRNGSGKDDLIKPTRVFSLKKDVEKINKDELYNLKGKLTLYNSIDKFATKNKGDKLSSKDIMEYTEFLDTVIDRQIGFKPNVQVMLTYNLDTDLGLVNGSRGVILTCDQESVNVLFKNGITCRIPYHMYEMEDGKVKMIRYQLPLILAYAISTHRTQGATLDCAILDIGPSIFAPGMSYVQLSRVKTLDGILISSFIPKKIMADPEALEFEKLMIEKEKIQDNECDVNRIYKKEKITMIIGSKTGKTVEIDIIHNVDKQLVGYITYDCPEIYEMMTLNEWDNLKNIFINKKIDVDVLYKKILNILELETEDEEKDYVEEDISSSESDESREESGEGEIKFEDESDIEGDENEPGLENDEDVLYI